MFDQHYSTIVVLVAMLSLGCQPKSGSGSEANPTQTNPSPQKPIRVVVKRPKSSDGQQELVLPGTIEAWEKAALYARIDGYLQSVSVDIGDKVKSGAEIAKIIVPEMKAELRSAEAKLRQEKAEHELARLTQGRLQKLRKANPEAIAQQEVDVATAKEHIESAQVHVAEAERDRLRALATFASVRAPFAGQITKRNLDPGSLVRAGTSADTLPIVELMQTDRLRLVFETPEPASPWIRKGTEVKLRFDAFRSEEITAKVSRVSGALNPSSRSMRAEIDLENAEHRYEPGMYASVHLSAQMINNALSIPSPAVRGNGSERYCLVVRKNILEQVPVVVAGDDGKTALIAKGLTTKDQVMIAGSPLAQAGSSVEAVEEGGS